MRSMMLDALDRHVSRYPVLPQIVLQLRPCTTIPHTLPHQRKVRTPLQYMVSGAYCAKYASRDTYCVQIHDQPVETYQFLGI